MLTEANNNTKPSQETIGERNEKKKVKGRKLNLK